MSREITKEEAREMFIGACKNIVNYWANVESENDKEKIEGAVFSMLTIIDGVAGDFPCSIDLVLRPHPEDKMDCINNGENWVVDGQIINDDCMLHDSFLSK